MTQAVAPGESIVDSSDIETLISDDGEWISRRLWHDPALYRLEQTRVFGRSWLLLGHESQIREPGDFFLSSMGEDTVIVTRDQTGDIRVHLNTCRHRGMAVCRADHGNTRTFVCPYHGWSYGLDGRLAGLPNQKQSYLPDIDRARLGLIPVPRIDTFLGFIFANCDPDAMTLTEHLGDMAFYLETSLGRRACGTEVLGIQKWRMRTNWKMPAENQVGDVAHGPVSHGSVLEIAGPDAMKPMNDILEHGRNVALRGGHGLTVRLYPDDGSEDRLPGEAALREAPGIAEYFRSVQPEAEARLGPLRARLKIATATVFPHLSLLGSNFTIRVAHPRGPMQSEIWSWVFVDRDAPPEVKHTLRQFYTLTFGPGGMFEQDDGENWEGVTGGAAGIQAAGHPFHFGMGLGTEGPDPDLPGVVGTVYSEHTQRAMYRQWQQLMLTP
jgi:phenylpropionate dioxygenase-like ring-hydroxylating dioxygenase large terminal subunit